jgi:serine/threonine protein kinase
MATATHAYKLLEICAAGTFGTVCVVRDLDRGTLVALKVLKESHLNRPRVLARTRDEATMLGLLSSIRHPGIVQVEGLVMLEDRPVVVMEWVRGLALESLLRAKPDGIPIAEAVEIIRQATLALGAAYHAVPPDSDAPLRIIHRDVKPSNMLLSVDGELKVVDFGIARAEFDGKEAKTLSMVLGARGYLAPERLDGDDDKPSCDIYSLGVTLYELLTGKHVVLSMQKDFHTEALQKNLTSFRPAGLSADATERLRGIVADMCRYEEAHRPSHEELVRRLDAFLRDFGVNPDLKGYARRELLPLFQSRKITRPIDHPAYPELAFVERMARMVKYPAPPDVDQEIRVFLRDPSWHDKLDELEVLFAKNPHWSDAPFLELLPSGSRAWWQFWGGGELPASQVAAVLQVLRQRRTPEVLDRARQLVAHSDPTVASAAGLLLRG